MSDLSEHETYLSDAARSDIRLLNRFNNTLSDDVPSLPLVRVAANPVLAEMLYALIDEYEDWVRDKSDRPFHYGREFFKKLIGRIEDGEFDYSKVGA